MKDAQTLLSTTEIEALTLPTQSTSHLLAAHSSPFEHSSTNATTTGHNELEAKDHNYITKKMLPAVELVREIVELKELIWNLEAFTPYVKHDYVQRLADKKLELLRLMDVG